jgi:ABC-2 type transport system permease protein
MNEVANKRQRVDLDLPSDLKQVVTVARYDVIKHLRSKRLFGLLLIEAAVLVLITVLPSLLGSSYPSDPAVFAQSYANFVSVLIVIGATLFAGDALVSEFQGRTGFLLFPNPIKRSSLLAGKYLASLGIMTAALCLFYLIVSLLGLAITGGFSTLILESLLLALLYSAAALAVGYLISSIMRGSTGALILTFALFFIIFSLVAGMLQVGGVKPWFIITFAAGTILDILKVPYPVDSSGSGLPAPGAGDISYTNFVPEVGLSIAVMLAYTIISLVLAYVFFRRREMSA